KEEKEKKLKEKLNNMTEKEKEKYWKKQNNLFLDSLTTPLHLIFNLDNSLFSSIINNIFNQFNCEYNNNSSSNINESSISNNDDFDFISSNSNSNIENIIELDDTAIYYSDGSLINSGTENISMSFGVVQQLQKNKELVKIAQGRVEGYYSSTKAELVGLYTTLKEANPNQNIIIYID